MDAGQPAGFDRVGTVYTLPPQPPDESCTRWIPAGSLVIGVEWRSITPADLVALYEHDPELLAELAAASPEGGFADEGVSFHVADAASGYEALRFDVFSDQPHYHYIAPGPAVANRVVPFDPVANGDMLAWALSCLRSRLVEMLEAAGAGDLAARVDPAAVERAALDVEREVAALRRRRLPADGR